MRVNLHLPEIYSVLGLRDRAMRAAGAGIEGSQTRLEVETKSTRGGGRVAIRRQAGCSDRCEATKSQ